jgi:hypothetical protein
MDMAFAVSGKRRSNGQLTRASILDLAHGFGHGGVLRFGKTDPVISVYQLPAWVN